ncbi:MAG: deoxyribonuclease V, partial [Ectothiorhodospira sp.]
LQQKLREHIITEDRLNTVHRVAGVDVGFEDHFSITRAGVVVLSYPELEPMDQAIARLPTAFPYVPGLLSFREIPAVLRALEGLQAPPDLLLCDGQGIAHPRRLGIAAHLGLITGLPAVGVGKSRLVGRHGEVGVLRGSAVPLADRGEVIGRVLRTRTGVRPVYVSTGHRVSLDTACELVLQAAPRYRLPEPIRRADRIASRRDGPRREGAVQKR